jgi:hypothetical protein
MTQKSGRLTIFPAAAVTDRSLGSAAFRVLAALGRHGDKDGWCYPSLKTLAADLGISRQAISKSIQQLVALGYVVTKEQRRADGSRTVNQYRLVLDYGADTPQRDVTPPQRDVDTPQPLEVDTRQRNAIDTPQPLEVDAANVPSERPIETPHTKERTKRAKRPPTPAPDDFPISERMRQWAATACPDVDLDRETQRFLLSARSKGREYADWLAAWQSWMVNDFPKFLKGARNEANGRGSPSRHHRSGGAPDRLAVGAAGSHGAGGTDSWAIGPPLRTGGRD